METNKCNNCSAENPVGNRYCSMCGFELPKSQTVVIEPQKVEPEKKQLKYRGYILGLIGAMIASLTTFYFNSPSYKNTEIDKVAMKAASEINKSCPIMVDKETRLDNTVALTGKIFRYNYTLVNYTKAELDTIAIKKLLEPNIIAMYKTSPDMKTHRDNEFTLEAYYKDKNGEYAFMIVTTPDQIK